VLVLTASCGWSWTNDASAKKPQSKAEAFAFRLGRGLISRDMSTDLIEWNNHTDMIGRHSKIESDIQLDIAVWYVAISHDA
jgi:hypothetical protein